jgi:hypothetical protein
MKDLDVIQGTSEVDCMPATIRFTWRSSYVKPLKVRLAVELFVFQSLPFI